MSVRSHRPKKAASFQSPADESSSIGRSSFLFRWEPRNASQAAAGHLFKQNDLLFLLGSPGSGKTFCALALALESGSKEVVVVRPSVEAGRPLGHRPGTIEEKMDPCFGPVNRLLARMVLGELPRGLVRKEPPTFMRGDTLERCVLVLDEAQNLQASELKLLLTRMGRDCKVIIAGDSSQADVRPTRDSSLNDLAWVVSRLEGLKGVAVVRFTEDEILRHPLVREIHKRL